MNSAAVLAAMGNYGLQCLALSIPDGTGDTGSASAVALWWPGISEIVQSPLSSRSHLAMYDSLVRNDSARLSFGWSESDADILLSALEILADRSVPAMHSGLLGDPHLFVWGGVRRVFHNLAREAPEMIPRIASLARKCYDPDFQFIRDKSIGFPIRADNIMDVMLGEQMVDDSGYATSDGEQALANPRDCLALAGQHKRLIDAIMAEGAVRWTAKSGKVARREIEGGWRTVGALMKQTYGSKDGKPITEPRRRWCNDDSFELHRLCGWMDGLEVAHKWS